MMILQTFVVTVFRLCLIVDKHLLKVADWSIFSGRMWTKCSSTFVRRGVIYSLLSLFVIAVSLYCGKDDAAIERLPDDNGERPGEVASFQVMSGDESVIISWNTLQEASGYKIFMDDDSGTSMPLKTYTDQDSLNLGKKPSIPFKKGLQDANMLNGKKYAFQIMATNAQGDGPLSGKVYAMPRPTSLGSLEGVTVNTDPSQVTLTWDAIELANKYIVRKKISTVTNFSVIQGDPPICLNGICTYEDTNVMNGTTYDYEVQAVMVTDDTDLPGYEDVTTTGGGSASALPRARTSSQVILSHAITDKTRPLADDAEVTLTITAPPTGGVLIMRYKIETLDAMGNPLMPPVDPIDVPRMTGMSTEQKTVSQPYGEARMYRVTAQKRDPSGMLMDITNTINTESVGKTEVLPTSPVINGLALAVTLTKATLTWVQTNFDTATHYTITRSFNGGSAVPIVTKQAIGVLSVINNQYTYENVSTHNYGTYTYTLTLIISLDTIPDINSASRGATAPLAVESLYSGIKINPMEYANTLIATGNTISVSGTAIGGNDETNNPEGAHHPFGMTTFTPLNALNTYVDGDNGGASDRWVHYSSRKHRVKGFAVTALNGPGCDAAGDFPIMMHPGQKKSSSIYYSNSVLPLYIKGTNIRNSQKGKRGDNTGTYPTSNVTGKPGYYKVIFENDMTAELTVGKRSGIAKFTLPASLSYSTLFFTTASSMTRSAASITGESALSGAANTKAIHATITNKGFCANNASAYTIYMYAEFDKNFTGNLQKITDSSKKYQQISYEFDLNTAGRVVHVKYGISYVSAQAAYNNLAAEISNFSFDTIKTSTQDAWKDLFRRVQVFIKPADKADLVDKLTLFYSGLYRSFHSPSIFSDADCKYKGFNNSIYTIPSSVINGKKVCNMTQYQTFSGWDTYRSQSQLITLIDRKISSDMAQSLINNSKQANCASGRDVDSTPSCGGGSLTRWGLANDDAGTMAGEPGSIIVANSLAFGAVQFKLDEALAAMDRGQSGARSDNKQLGSDIYTPFKNQNQDRLRSSELELASAYFAKAAFAQRLAKIKGDSTYAQRYGVVTSTLGKTKSAYESKATTFFDANKIKFRLSTNERTISDLITGYDSSRDLRIWWQEGNIHQYKWMYPPNVAGGTYSIVGKYFSGMTSQAITELDTHVTKLNSGTGRNDSGLFFGNEPGHFTPFVYNFLQGASGATETQAPYSARSQTLIQRIQTEMYKNQINQALPGNEDLGAMAAWYVWTAIGLYPSIPGLGFYNLTSPLFDRIIIEKDDGQGGLILIRAPNSKDRRYITNIKLHENTYSKTYITFKDLYQELGQTLQLSDATGVTRKVTKLEFVLQQSINNATSTLEVSPSFDNVMDMDDFL